ncbi:MAG: flagellar filament capping protein FliD [Nitrospiraceae bacterium]|nr:MAG: flagellar filament capping protein FliD [Nitrospiraceae bacterium]
MSSFSIGGLNTGIDYNELISQLIEIRRRPIDILETKRTDYNSKISTYAELSTKLSDLRNALNKLKTTSGFYVKTSSASDSTVIDSTATGTASVGNYSVSVTTLASAEKEVHNGTGLTASTDIVNSSGSDKVFQYTYGTSQRSLTVADGTTLDGLKNLINDDTSNPGVTATVVNDGTNYRLVISGNETGAANTVTIDTGTTLDGTGSTVDFTASAFAENKTAADAEFTVDGLQITRSTNSISDVINGVTLTLKKENSSSTVTVSADNESIKEQIQEYVTSYNDVVSFISTNSIYDTNTKESGIFVGEGTTRHIQDNLRTLASNSVSGLSGSLSILAQIGITTDYETGNLEINSATLETKLGTNLDDVADLFKDSTEGIAVKMSDYISNILSKVDGSIELRKDGLQDVINSISNTIRNMEYRLEKAEDDMVRKFSALELLVGNYNTIGNYLTGFSTQA